MQKLTFLILVFYSGILRAQTIYNNSFEYGSDTSVLVPKFWGFKIVTPNGKETHLLTNKIFAARDSSIVHSKKFSLKLLVADSNNFFFSAEQQLKINITKPKAIRIVTWIKTNDCKKGAGLNCTQINKLGEDIGYTSSRQQEVLVTNTTEWAKTELIVLLHPATKTLKLNAFMYGAGTVWFDDISIEEFATGKKLTAPIVTDYLDTLIKIVKVNSLFKDSLNWKILTNQLKDLASGMQTYREASLLSNYILSELRQHGDHHSSFLSATFAKQFATGDIGGRGRNVKTQYLGQGVGYISIPGFASINDSVCVSFAANAQALIKKIDTENEICGWIVDLRDNDGGSMSPMITAIGPILGEGMFALDYSYTAKGDTGVSFYKNGESYFVLNGKRDSLSTKVLHPYKLKNENVPVAVLIGKGCGSSGECTAAAFIGRKDSKLFGEPTAGFTTANADFTLPDGSMLFIAAGILTDRSGKKYPERIFPDVQIKESLTDKTDNTLEQAKKWLVSIEDCK